MAGTTRLDLLTGAGPGTSSPLFWQGGKLALMATSSAWGGGSVQYQMQFGAQWLNVGAAFTANGMQVVELPPGQIQAVVTTATGVNASAVTVPTLTTR